MSDFAFHASCLSEGRSEQRGDRAVPDRSPAHNFTRTVRGAGRGATSFGLLGCVPQPDRAVFTSAGDLPTVRAEGHAVNGVFVASEGKDLAGGCRVPQPHGHVLAAAGNALSVRLERTARTLSACPLSVRVKRPCLASHSLTVLNWVAVAMSAPSGPKARSLRLS